ncbi:ABC transporter ATP-binding protein [Ornithinimicrobium avium]|uniref:ABC transporter ATP-binding protein n=1 Tax=Ornithinimicrobium avium TaxID=2283195 RepID=A0A345NMW7_9MICO|nr:ABC transporter ATP-binding protein [Ornithinimicrobium avium]AXH96375.1 ABC transporter ATP-binding protein [Ornithinimicrobium avium]
MTAPLLTLDRLTISFPDGSGSATPVLQDMSFELARGESLGIVGQSGSGKSMTALAIMGLLPPEAAYTGEICFDGTDVTHLPDRRMRALRGDRMAMIFQDPLSSLNPYYTVGSQIAEAYRAHRGGSRRAAHKVAVEAMEAVHIRDARSRVDHYPHQFSGGMRQRIMIAMALACEPDLIIADEPTTALDVTVQAQVLGLIDEVQERMGSALIFITHDLAVVAQVSDRVLVLKEGQVVETGRTRDVFSSPRADYTRELLAATPRIDDPVPDLLTRHEVLAAGGRPEVPGE